MIDLKLAWVMPGIVDLHSHLGDTSSPELDGASGDDNSLKGPVRPWLHALDSLNMHDESHALSIAGGATTAGFRETYNKAREIKEAQDQYCANALRGDWDTLTTTAFPEDIQMLGLVNAGAVQNKTVQHGAALRLGVAGMGGKNAEAYDDLKETLFADSAVAGEAIWLCYGSDYARLGTRRSFIVTIGLAFIFYGRQEEADDMVKSLMAEKDPILRYGGPIHSRLRPLVPQTMTLSANYCISQFRTRLTMSDGGQWLARMLTVIIIPEVELVMVRTLPPISVSPNSSPNLPLMRSISSISSSLPAQWSPAWSGGRAHTACSRCSTRCSRPC
ncbi:hypothetical protein A0H81_13952 [Grifola frondosa]|uniref:Uncharacterized protein n=1 Tax=Grifola frondosa TaxID=5627 RepID=A0A1C7LPF2_GRIFR|nr:hypothetical protein A0H81_13952 [Grifola frondosa]